MVPTARFQNLGQFGTHLQAKPGMEAAGMLWAAAFFIFLPTYGPVLFRRRFDERDG